MASQSLARRPDKVETIAKVVTFASTQQQVAVYVPKDPNAVRRSQITTPKTYFIDFSTAFCRCPLRLAACSHARLLRSRARVTLRPGARNPRRSRSSPPHAPHHTGCQPTGTHPNGSLSTSKLLKLSRASPSTHWQSPQLITEHLQVARVEPGVTLNPLALIPADH